ncbi:solute carrier family 22 member 3-like isoform X1 [Choristoneura fumiferana]|uniref:solute carrier family 22 member 3-like isoform X1 n=1 Tax=Choristoneura fumiferana TaxID=7141 RepID=UPI003D157C55
MDLNVKPKENNSIQAIEPPEQKQIGAALEAVIKDVGEMGLYQKLLFVGMMPFGFVWAFVYLGHMFVTPTPQEHWCRVPELAELAIELRRSLSIPTSASASGYDRCLMYDANWTQVLESLQPPAPGTPTVPCRHGWEFLFEDIPYSSVVSERDWVCDRAVLVAWSQAISFLGSIVGGISLGYFADMFGRIPALFVANLVGCVGGVATIFTTGFWDFSLCRFLVGIACDGCFLFLYILVLEYVGVRHRAWVANMSIALYFGGGCLALPWLALWVADWRHFLLATSLPMLLVVLTPILVPESVGWLVSKGRVDEAVTILRRFEKINKTKISQEALDEFIVVAKTTKRHDESLIIIFKNKNLRKTVFFLVISFMACALVFDGLIRLSEHLGLDFFLTFTFASATEIPSIALLVLLIDRFGRRKLVSGPLILGGVIAFVGAFVPRGVASVALAVTARFFSNMAYSAVIQWTPELLPTAVRASGASFVHVSGFVAAFFSPFLVYSERVWEDLPLVLVGVAAVVGGAVALLLPETAGRPLPQTLAEWDRIAAPRARRAPRPSHLQANTD